MPLMEAPRSYLRVERPRLPDDRRFGVLDFCSLQTLPQIAHSKNLPHWSVAMLKAPAHGLPPGAV